MSKLPFITEAKAREIAAVIPTPFHVYDEAGLRKNAQAVKDAFSWNEGFREYFAVKANPNPFILKIFQEYGFGTDCASMTELMLSNALGFKNEEIMFSSNDTPAEEFKYAASIGATINLDDFTHIEFCKEALGGKLPKRMSCRFNPGGVYEISNGIMDNPGDAKYGFTREQIIEGYRILKEYGVEEFGIHSFLVSNTVTNDYYPALARTLFELIVDIKNETGVEISFVNLSGGVGIPYRPEQVANDISVIGAGVKAVYDEILVPAGMKVSLCTEMGRFMTGPYGGLVTTAIHEKNTYKNYIGVDACAVNLMRPAIYGAYHHITVLGKENEPETMTYDVTGSLCENCDKFAVDRPLPKVEIGDILFIHDAGAHGYSMGYNYNGKLKSAEVLLKEDGSFEMIRRAETSKDYFATFDCFDIIKDLV